VRGGSEDGECLGEGRGSTSKPFVPQKNRRLIEDCKTMRESLFRGMEKMMMERREFVGGMIGAGVALATERWSDAAREVLRPGLELYSVRNEMDRDVPGALAMVRRMGFAEVEVAMLHGLSANQFAAALKAAGLKATSMAAGYEDLQTRLDLVKERAEAFSVQWVMLGWIPHSGEFTREDAKRVAREMNEWSESLRGKGLRLAYHPHGYEFRPQAGETAFDVLLKESNSKTVFFEIDTFWAEVAGQNCAQLIARLGSRVRLLHLKDLRKGAKTGVFTGSAADEDSVAVGDGVIDWQAVLAAARKARVERYFIEDESPAVEKQIPRSLEFLARM
jgi:sugar phosphate isomerase/epimerase